MKGKEKCKALKEIRRQIAEKNDIPYVVSQCKHQGDCLGTCPRCEAELRYLERELAIRQGLGKAAVVAGISMSVCASLTACASVTEGTAPADSSYEELSGDVEIYDGAGYMEEPPYDDDDSLPQTDTDETEEMGKTEDPEETETPDKTEEPEVTTDIAGDISIENMNEFPANR